MIGLKWVGPLGDASGYAAATRGYIESILATGEVDLCCSAVTFEKEKTSHGKTTSKIKELMNKTVPHRIQVTHLTPENYPNALTTGKYNIGYCAWETDKLPDGWTDLCNLMDEIWVPSNWNAKVFKDSGVKRPIQVIPHGIAKGDLSDAVDSNFNLEDDVYVFYWIGQWLERKHPAGLLRAYLSEFLPDERVCLVLKTYRLDTSATEQNLIMQDIKTIKSAMRLKDFPQLRFFGTLLTHEQIKGIHKRGNCLISCHKAEGFGLTCAEAMSYGKPVIASGYSGNLDFMNKDNSYLIRCNETPVYNMLFPNYNAHMTWGDPDISHLKKLMRHCFEHREEANRVGMLGKKEIETNFNWKKIGNLIVKRLKEIEGLS